MKKRFVLWLVLSVILLTVIPTYALDLIESTPKDGATEVALDSQILLLFDKNVVNFKIKDNNLGCFTLRDEQDQVVPVEVIFADDQIVPEKKREVILKPKSSLKKNSIYKVEISPDLQAKNGTSLKKKVVISFKTLTEL